MNTETKPITRGGARKGAGRPPGKTRMRVMFMIPITTVAALKTLPLGARSKFVSAAIQKALDETRRRHA